MPAPFVLAAFEALLSSVPTLIRHFGSGKRSEDNAKLAETIVPIAKAAIGATNEQELVERVQTDPQAVAAIDVAMRDNWLVISESGGGGIAGAREYNLAVAASGASLRKQPAFLISLVLLLFPLMMAVDVFFVHPGVYTAELRTQIVTGILLIISIVGSFWLGSSMSSRAKDEALMKR